MPQLLRFSRSGQGKQELLHLHDVLYAEITSIYNYKQQLCNSVATAPRRRVMEATLSFCLECLRHYSFSVSGQHPSLS